MLAVITALPILAFIILLCVVVFVIYPKVKNSNKIDNLTDRMTLESKKTTDGLIDSIKDAKGVLNDRSKEASKTIKQATVESDKINKALGKDEKKETN